MKPTSPFNARLLRVRVLFSVLFAFAAAACVSKHEGPSASDTTTNWLHACTRNADCHGESSCLGGLCTIACASSAESPCRSLAAEAECVEPEAVPAHCDLPCVDGACESLGDDYACDEGACRPKREVAREQTGQSNDMDASASEVREPPLPIQDSGLVAPDVGFVFPVDAGEIDGGFWCPEAGLPTVTWQPPSWEPFTSDAGPDELFRIVKQTFVGRWHGLATVPWKAPYLVDIEFKPDGHYSAHCSDGKEPCCTAFDEGTDQESELKQYWLLDAQASGYLVGDIDIAFWTGERIQLSSAQGKLTYIERDRSGDGLRLRYGSIGTTGVRFDLRRVTTP